MKINPITHSERRYGLWAWQVHLDMERRRRGQPGHPRKRRIKLARQKLRAHGLAFL